MSFFLNNQITLKPKERFSCFPPSASCLTFRKINTGYIPKLKKGEVLAFVDKIVFNTADVTLSGKTGVDGSCEASWNVFVKFLLAVSMTNMRFLKTITCMVWRSLFPTATNNNFVLNCFHKRVT